MTLYKATASGQVPMTPNEEAAFEASRAPKPPTKEEHNASILAQLVEIDTKSIRALREGNTQRIQALESQAAMLRTQLLL